MRDKNNPGLRFFAPSAAARLRAAMSRAHERGVSWHQVDRILKDNAEDGPEEAIRLLHGLKPLASDDIEEEPASPSLDERRAAWMRLNRVFR
jgi:hypothetical protein